jgi:hypothetical protein
VYASCSTFVYKQKNYLDLFEVIAEVQALAALLLVRIVRIYSANTQFLRQHCSFLLPDIIAIFSFSSSRFSTTFTHAEGITIFSCIAMLASHCIFY